MITVKCTTELGSSWITGINATSEEAREYFLGKWFNVGRGENDCMELVTAVEEIKD